ncbi:MAG: hypothetical protein ACI35W_03960 [Anaeroplasmataceae bacterium]
MYDKIINNKESIIKNIFAYTLFILVFAVEGCFNFVDSSFEIDRLLEISLWSRIALKVILLVLIRLGAYLVFLDIARAKNMDLINAKAINERFLKLKSNDFSKYITTVKNREIKIEAWKRKISKKLAKLEKKSKTYDKSLYYKSDSSKEYNKYCIRRKELEELLSDEWINSNYHLISIKCTQINPSVFDLPIGTDTNDKPYQLTSKTKASIFVGLLSSSVLMVLGQTLINATVFSYKDVTAIEIFIGLMTDFVFIITQFFTGMFGAYSTIRNNEVLPYINRNRILKEYLFWKNPTNPDTFTKWIEQLENIEIKSNCSP